MLIAMKQSLAKITVTLATLVVAAMSLGQSSWTLTTTRPNYAITREQSFYLSGVPAEVKRAPFTDRARCRQVSGPNDAPWTSYYVNTFDNSWDSDTWYVIPSSGEIYGEVYVNDAWGDIRSGLDGWTHSGTSEYKLRDLAWIQYASDK
jgi:hypothetical protein